MRNEDKYLAANLDDGFNVRRSGHYEPVVRSCPAVTAAPRAEEYGFLGRVASRRRHANAVPRTCPAFDSSGPGRQDVTLTFFGLFRKPWAHKWGWVLLAHAVLSAIFYAISRHSGSAVANALYALVMSMAVPSAMTCLFCEWDITRKAAPGMALLAAVAGGCVSATFAGELNGLFGIADDNALAAAFTEEPLKGVMAIVAALQKRRFPCILSGLAMGCAIGAGFAVVETFGYSYVYSSGGAPSTPVLLLRGVLSPLMHMAWTAAFAGAIWKARGVDGDWRKVVCSPSVWLVLCGMMLCHAVWNAVGIVNLATVAQWGLLLHYVRHGVTQAVKENLVSMEVKL